MTNDITVKIKADNRQLKTGMDQASRSVKDFSAEAQRMSVNVAKAGAVVVTAVAAIGAGVLKMASEAAQAGVEVRNLADVAGTSTTNFQRMAQASRTVGVEQEKLSDILKDVNDKFGDYMATGAGPLADFFENIAPKIGVTAEQFANLAGPDALQLYVDSLEKAGVSQQQMTFYLEALASDTTRLLPLLRNGGIEMARLGDEAERTGRIMSEDMIANAVELDRELADLSNTLKVQATAAVLEYKDEIIGLINFITDRLIPSIGGFLQWVDDGVEGWKILGRAANDYLEKLKEIVSPSSPYAALTEFGGGDTAAPIIGRLTTNPETGEPFAGGGAASELQDYINTIAPQQGPQTPAGWMPSTSGAPLDPSGGLLPQDPAMAARAAWEATQELQEEIRTGTADHEAELTRIEDDARRERERLAAAEVEFKRQAMATLYNDLTSLMSSENDKLFKIGKAAAIAEATISGFYSAQKAYEGGLRVSGGNIAVGAAFAAASIAKTAGVISSLQSTQPNGGGRVSSGSAGAASTPTAGGQEQGITQNRSLTLIGDNFNRKQAIDIAEYMNEGTDNGLIIRGRA